MMTNNKVKRNQLVATLGFLDMISLTEAENLYKGVKVEELKIKLINIFNKLAPESCQSCKMIYDCNQCDTGAGYFLCGKQLCPKCCPKIQENDQFMRTLFPLCGLCVSERQNECGGSVPEEPIIPPNTLGAGIRTGPEGIPTGPGRIETGLEGAKNTPKDKPQKV